MHMQLWIRIHNIAMRVGVDLSLSHTGGKRLSPETQVYLYMYDTNPDYLYAVCTTSTFIKMKAIHINRKRGPMLFKITTNILIEFPLVEICTGSTPVQILEPWVIFF